jgi:hypothetical protein
VDIRYFLIRATNKLVLISTTLSIMAARIANIYLIGQYLYLPFAYTALYLVQLAVEINNVGDAVENAFDYIESRLNSVTDTSGLFQYASRLIAFILNPIPTVFRAIRTLYPVLDEIADNTYNFIRPFVVSIIREVFGNISDIETFVRNIINSLIPDFNLLRFNPIGWVIDKIRQYSGLLGNFISDPNGFIIAVVRAFFPDLWVFIQDPRGFIMEKLIEGFEILANQYLLRIQKIVENVLNIIF